MTIIKDQSFGGERPLFATHDLRLENITITDGESGIKQCQNMESTRGGTLTVHASRIATSHSVRVLPSGTPTTL